MIEYKLEILEGDKWINRTNLSVFPINISKQLDTGLDSGSIILWNTTIKEPYKPFTQVRITCKDITEKIYRYIIALDNVELNNFGGNTYTHNISLIEKTKLLERRTVDNLTVTQAKLKGFGGDVEPISPEIGGDQIIVDDIEDIIYFLPNLITIGDKLYIPRKPGYNTRYGNFVVFKNPDNKTYLYQNCSVQSSFGDLDFNKTILMTNIGDFFIKIILGFGNLSGTETYTLTLTYNFSVTNDILQTQKTITSELQRLIEVTPIRRNLPTYYDLVETRVDDNFYADFRFFSFYKNYTFNNSTGEIICSNQVTNFDDLIVGNIYYENQGNNLYSYNILEKIYVGNPTVRCILTQYTSTEINNNKAEFVIDPRIISKFINTRCPEFNFTKMTLWECLLQIGEYIHAIPRLASEVELGIGTDDTNWNIITFDFLGLQKNATLFNEIFNTSSNNMEQYCTELDSYVDNLINTETEGKASIIEPGEGLFKTVTTDDGFLVTNDNCKIILDYPIYELKKVLVRYENQVVDITKYCYESYEYKILSNYLDIYPYSKKYALAYTIGDNTISQLQYKLENAVDQSLTGCAIANILDVEGISINVEKLNTLQYQVEYIPITSTRMKQRKVNYDEYEEKSTLFYNQSANMVDSVAYGENLKGNVLRLSNNELQKTLRFKELVRIPNIGEVIGNYYIAQINLQFYAEYINCTIQLSKDFNRLSKYIGISSFNRMYEVSERQTVERDINYSTNISIGFIEQNNPFSIVTNAGKNKLIDGFIQRESQPAPTLMLLTTYKKDKTPIKTVALPMNVLAMGNSLIFSSKFKDNYSAGNKIIKKVIDLKNSLNYIPYNNEFGEFEYLSFKICSPANGNNLDNLADTLPEIEYLTTLPPLFSSNYSTVDVDGALIVKKGNREIPKINIQFHFITNEEKFIIGYYLTHFSKLLNVTNYPAYIYALPNKINKFDKLINLAGVTLIKELTVNDIVSTNGSSFYIKGFKVPTDCQSIAVCSDSGRLLLGINNSFSANEECNNIFFNC